MLDWIVIGSAIAGGILAIALLYREDYYTTMHALRVQRLEQWRS